MKEPKEVAEVMSDYARLRITGYSRAAAIANLTAAMTDEWIEISSRFSLGTDTVFARCFESSLGALIRFDLMTYSLL